MTIQGAAEIDTSLIIFITILYLIFGIRENLPIKLGAK